MFICERCNRCVKSRVSCKKVITKRVKYLHPERPKARKSTIILKNGKKKTAWLPDVGGWGEQIVKETKMCPDCASRWEKEQKQLVKEANV